MIDATTYRSSFFALVLALFVVTSAGAEVIEHKGWLYGEEADEAIKYAKENGTPVAVMRVHRETTCPKCIGAARKMAASKSANKMVRVMAYYGGSDEHRSEAASELFNQARGQAADPSNWIPDLYFMMPDGRAIGFVSYEDAASAEAKAKKVAQIAEWINGVDKAIEKADRDAEKGRYESALKAVDKIVEQDAQISHLVQIQLGQVEDDDEMPDTPASPFFDGLRDEKIAEYNALAMEKLSDAEALIEKGELREAQRLLRPLARMPKVFAAKTAANQLMDEVVEKLKSS